MTQVEIEQCFAALRGAYPGEWTGERYIMWGKTFAELGLSFTATMAAIEAMVHTERFPSIAAFVDVAKPSGEPVADGDRRFLPGSGWLGGELPSCSSR